MAEIIISFIGTIGVITSMVYSYLAYKRSGHKDLQSQAQREGILISDLAYIKSCIDRMETKLDNVENNYQSLLLRIVKLEENYNNLINKTKGDWYAVCGYSFNNYNMIFDWWNI